MNDINGKAHWAFQGLIGLLMTVVVWLASQVWDGQRKLNERLNTMDVTSAGGNYERRITKLEDAFERIYKRLDEIKAKQDKP